MSTTPVLQLKDVTKYYRVGRSVVHAMEGISFDLGTRETLALVGESGCGKTTTGKIVADLEQPTSGQVLYLGNDIHRMSRKEYADYRRNVQFVHQDPFGALNPVKTVYQTLAAPLRQHRIATSAKELRDRVSDLLRVVGLEPPIDFLSKYPHQLSGGQRQRIVFARAIVPSPKIICADEPVSMIDVSLRIGILDLMLGLQERLGVAYLFITHDLGVARYFARSNPAAVMYLGQIVELGPVDRLIREPLHPYTQALISAVPVPDIRLARKGPEIALKDLDIPPATNPPPGCPFSTRCMEATPECDEAVPPLRDLGGGRKVACFRR